MKKIAWTLATLLASRVALAVEVGELIPVDRSQIQCKDVTEKPCRRSGYAYCDDLFGTVTQGVVTLSTGSQLGLGHLDTTGPACSTLDKLHAEKGEPLSLEVTEVTTRKVADKIRQYITLVLNLGSPKLVFQGSKDL